jgi:hypothetical protein
MREKLVSEAFALTCSLNEPSNIDELDIGRDYLRTIHDEADLLETLIVDIHDTCIGFYSTERKVRSLSGIGLGESIEESGFTDIRETNDTNLHEKKEKVLKFELDAGRVIFEGTRLYVVREDSISSEECDNHDEDDIYPEDRIDIA